MKVSTEPLLAGRMLLFSGVNLENLSFPSSLASGLGGICHALFGTNTDTEGRIKALKVWFVHYCQRGETKVRMQNIYM